MVADSAAHLKALNGFLGKSDGKDKLTALIQYACMFISAGEPGNAKKIQASVAAARKVFRVMRPLESISPVLLNPRFNPSKPVPLEVINKLKSVLMAIYFACDHVVWASQAGIYTNKEVIEKCQKTSLYGWFGGSLCTCVTEIYELLQLSKVRRVAETDEGWTARRAKAEAESTQRTLVLTHALVQAALAVGLLQLRPWKPRFVGFLGVVASAMNCYMLFPALPSSPAPAAKPAKALPVPGTCPAPAAAALAAHTSSQLKTA